MQPEKTAIEFEDLQISYAAFDRQIDQFAQLLTGLGCQHGDRVACLGENTPDQLALFFACARQGLILVTLNWRLAGPEHAYQIRNSGARLIFADPAFQQQIDQFHGEFSQVVRISTTLDTRDGWQSLPDLLSSLDNSGEALPATGSDEDPVLLVYTSGTTGRPKGAVLTQRNILWNAINGTHSHDMTSQDVILTNLPLFHVGGLNNQTTPALHAGATVILQRRFEPDTMLQAIESRRPTLTLAVPAVLNALITHPDWPTTDISSLRLLMAGSTTVPTAMIEQVHARGLPVGQIYGSTETCPIAIVLRAGDAMNKVGSCGKPVPHCQARIIDRDGQDVPAGQPGELLVRGANVFREYWNNPAATEESFLDGWFRTGDIAHQDEDGFYFIDDRSKDVIISGGENIYPAELEQVLAHEHRLTEAAVIGRQDDRWDEVPVVVAVLREGEIMSAEDVRALFTDRIARYKHPHDVIFVDALPRNALGKILKFELRAAMQEGRL